MRKLAEKVDDEKIYYFEPNASQILPMCMLVKEGLIIGSNQLGKTEGICALAVMLCGGIHPWQKMGLFPKPPIYGRITASDREHGIEDILEPKLLGGKIEKIEGSGFMTKRGLLKYDKLKKKIYFTNGSTIKLMSRESDTVKFAGKPLHFVLHDEPPEKYGQYKENTSRLTKYNGFSGIAMTPDPEKGLTWVYKEIIKRDGREGVRVFKGHVLDNINNLSLDGVREFRKGLRTPEQVKARWDGDFVALSGIVFAMFREYNIGKWVEPDDYKRWALNLWFRGLDLGMGQGSPTVCLWAAVVKHECGINQIHIVDEYGRENKTISENASEVKALHKGICIYQTFIDPVTSMMRSAVNKRTQKDEWADNGIYTVLGLRDKRLTINAVKEMMLLDKNFNVPRLIIHENCVETINEIQDWTEKDIDNNKKGHYISALRWLCAGRINEYSVKKIPGAIYSEQALKYREETQNMQLN